MENLDNPPLQQQPSSVRNSPENFADDPDFYVQGYPKLSYFFSQCPRYLHLRRFSALSIRVQLYQQHELVMLEKRLMELEERENHIYCKDYEHMKTASNKGHISDSEQRNLYDTIKTELKEYEESLIRFSTLSSRGWDDTALGTVQRFIMVPEGCGLALAGVDAKIWGSVASPGGHASDLIQVVQQVQPSLIGKLFNNTVHWTPHLPAWLRLLLFWTKKQPDLFHQYSFSARAFENVALAVGNILTSLLVYGAVTLLYLSTSRALKVTAVILLALTVTVCTVLFQNQKFVVLLATICAVLVTLLASDSRLSNGG